MVQYFYARIDDLEHRCVSIVELPFDERDTPGWNDLVRGWSLGSLTSEAVIRIDEPALDNARLGIVPASNHKYLYGSLLPGGPWPDIPFPRRSLRELGDGEVEVSIPFDHYPLRIGRFWLRIFWSLDDAAAYDAANDPFMRGLEQDM